MSHNLIWDYFIKSKTEASEAKCNECAMLLSLGSNKSVKQTVHGQKSHLEKCHPEIFAVYTTKVSKHSE